MAHAEGPLSDPNTYRHPCPPRHWDIDTSVCVNNNHINGGDPTLKIQNTLIWTIQNATAAGNPLLAGTTNAQNFLDTQWAGYHSPGQGGGCNWFANRIIQWQNQIATTTNPQVILSKQSKIDWALCMWDTCCIGPDLPAPDPYAVAKMGLVDDPYIIFKKRQSENSALELDEIPYPPPTGSTIQ